jgi:putative beta barrel porin BBP7
MRLLLSMSILLGTYGGLSFAQDQLIEHEDGLIVSDESVLQQEACQLGDSCSESCISDCDACMGDGCRFWGRVDYLLWWTKGSKLPPLITTSTNPNDAGILGRPTTSILYGDEYVNNDVRSGFRAVGGFWLDCCHTIGIGADYLDLGTNSDHGGASGNGNPILARPYFSAQTGQQAAQRVSDAGLAGTVTSDSRDYLQSAGSWFRMNLVNCQCVDDCSCGDACNDGCCGRWGFGIDMLMGYRYYRMDDSLTVREDLLDISGGPTDGTTFQITDDFRTENRFHGGEIGFRTTVERGCWSLGLLTKMAIGSNRYEVTIDGSTTTTIPGFPTTIDANGILATQSNIGVYEDDQFAVIPQLGLELGYQIQKNIDLFVGYNLIYWPHVQRAADQIDLNVDPRNWPPVQAGALPYPAPKLCGTDFWAQGINFGVGCRY